MPEELRQLMLRYCQLGRLLPRLEDFDAKDPRIRSDYEVLRREMAGVLAEIYAFVDAARAAREGHAAASPE
jgi:hypothetical protein